MTRTHFHDDWFSAPLPENVRLGERTYLYSSFAFSHYRSRAKVGVRVGNDSGLYPGTFFDLGPAAQVEIGNFCSLVGVIFATKGRVSIGDYTVMAHEVVIADTHWATPLVNAQKRDDFPTSVEIGQNVWIGAQVVIIGNVRIGEGSIIGAGTLVTQVVPPYTICAGNPMRIVRAIPR
jgi:acetyltransferase-like isoleucine patch superfamily enzyme